MSTCSAPTGRWRMRRRAPGSISRTCRPAARTMAAAATLDLGRVANENPPKLHHHGRQGQPAGPGRVPSRLSRHDDQKHRPRHPCLGARRQRQAGPGLDARRAALSRDPGRERAHVPCHHDPCLHRRTQVRAGAARQMAAQDPDPHLRSAALAVVGEEWRHARHGHDRAPGRHRRARQHHPRGRGRRSCRDHRPQMVHVGADVRCLPGARPGWKAVSPAI